MVGGTASGPPGGTEAARATVGSGLTSDGTRAGVGSGIGLGVSGPSSPLSRVVFLVEAGMIIVGEEVFDRDVSPLPLCG